MQNCNFAYKVKLQFLSLNTYTFLDSGSLAIYAVRPTAEEPLPDVYMLLDVILCT